VRVQFLVLTVLLAPPAFAHETLHQVVQGKAVAVRAYESDGEPLALTPFEVYSPAEPKVAWTTGTTDRDGWLAFVPNGPGRWRVRVIEVTGHGLDLSVDVPVAAGAPAALSAAGPVEGAGGAAFLLRPLLGLAVIGLVFTALVLAWRKKGRASPR